MKNISVLAAAAILLLFSLVVPFESADAFTIKKGDRIKIIDSTDQIYEGKISTIDSNSITLSAGVDKKFTTDEIKNVYLWKNSRGKPTRTFALVGFAAGCIAGYTYEKVHHDYEFEMTNWGGVSA